MLTLRPYQEDGLTAIWDYFSSGQKGNPVLAWPTGTGKSAVPAVFIERVMKRWPDQRFLMITHVSELIKQNAEVLKFNWRDAPLGIFSAGLKAKDFHMPIVFGGIQSMIKNPAQFGHRDIIFIDEAHLISQDDSSQYLTFLSVMKLINPAVKVVGMTATPYRMGQGLITDGGLFTDIVQDLTSMENFNRLIADGYLAPLIPRRTHIELNIDGVGIQNGDYVASQLQKAVDKKEITFAGLKELVHAGQDRKSWLLFASGIEHAEHIAAMLTEMGVDCAAVHSKQKSDYNDAAIKAFKSNSLRSIVNFGKLTTGFNHPDIDLIGDFRPTMSIPLHVQKLGRGTRPAPNKQNCLVLDFGKNVPRLGPINDPIIPRKKGDAKGEIPIKICESCGVYNHISARICDACGAEFIFKVKIVSASGTVDIIKSDLPIVETFDVQRVIYAKKEGKEKPYIRVSYFCGMNFFSEMVFPEAKGLPRHKFNQWWMTRHKTNPPLTTDDALKINSELRAPKRIRVWTNKNKYPEILGYEY